MIIRTVLTEKGVEEVTRRWFSLILAGCMLMQLIFGSSSGYMRAETESKEPAEVSDEVWVQNVEPQPETAEGQEWPVQNISEEETQTRDQKDEKPRIAPIKQNNSEDREEPVRKQINGSITVSFFTGKGLSERRGFQLTLKHGSGEETRIAVLEAVQGTPAASAIFENLPEGTYSLQVTAKGYRTYEQTFQTDGYDQNTQLYSGTAPQLFEDIQSGLLTYAASNVQTKDLIDAPDRGSMGSIYDINQDGMANPTDLQRLYDERREYKQQTSAIERRIPKSTVGTSIEAGTQLISGELEDVLTVESAVTLERADGQAISTDHPSHLTFDFQQNEDPIRMEGFTTQTPLESVNKIVGGMILVRIERQDKPLQMPVVNYYRFRRAVSPPYVEVDVRGNLIVHLGDQIAMKRMTIKVTRTTRTQGSLIEISKIEFLNDMETRILKSEMNVPKNLQGTTGDREFTASWTPERNVTGYGTRTEADGHRKTVKITIPSVIVT